MKTIMNYLKALTNDIVGQKRYETQNEIEDLKLGLKLADKANKKVRERDAVARASEAAKEVRRRSALASIKLKADELSLSEIDKIQNEIDDNIFHDRVYHVISSHVPDAMSSPKLKAWSSRPRHWVDVVEHFKQYGYQSVCKEYEVELFAKWSPKLRETRRLSTALYPSGKMSYKTAGNKRIDQDKITVEFATIRLRQTESPSDFHHRMSHTIHSFEMLGLEKPASATKRCDLYKASITLATARCRPHSQTSCTTAATYTQPTSRALR
jgi:hypothetical protein